MWNDYFETKWKDGLDNESNVPEYAVLFNDSNITYEFAMPGFKKDQISIETNSVNSRGDLGLLIKTLNANDTKSKSWIRNKIYNFAVAPHRDYYDANLTTSKLEDGILYVTIPKKAEKIIKKTKIEIG